MEYNTRGTQRSRGMPANNRVAPAERERASVQKHGARGVAFIAAAAAPLIPWYTGNWLVRFVMRLGKCTTRTLSTQLFSRGSDSQQPSPPPPPPTPLVIEFVRRATDDIAFQYRFIWLTFIRFAAISLSPPFAFCLSLSLYIMQFVLCYTEKLLFICGDMLLYSLILYKLIQVEILTPYVTLSIIKSCLIIINHVLPFMHLLL